MLLSLLLLGALYVGAYVIFLSDSKDFIVVRRNEKATDAALHSPLQPPIEIPFGTHNRFGGLLGGGWNASEVDGVWSQEQDAWVEIAVHGPGYAGLRVFAQPFLPSPRRHMKISISVNNAHALTWIRDRENVNEPFLIPASNTAPRNGLLDVHIHTDGVASPFLLRLGPDRRLLGVHLTSIQILAESAVK
ncbi:MAG: hypothetical protein ACYC9L_16360 [Sulfuricaulis sp.]